MSVGIVSATGREGQFESAYLTDMIQTDAAISPGSSGGGLFDGGAQLIGITTGGAARGENIGFAIPIRRAFEVLGSSLGGETLPAAVPDEAASGDRVPNGQSPERRRAPRYHDIDRFFAEIEPDAGHIEMFGTGLWSTAKNLAGEGSTLHESQLWHPAGAAFDWSGKQWPNGTTVTTTVIAPPVALGRRLIYAAVRLDFSSAGVESDFTLFDPARTKEG